MPNVEIIQTRDGSSSLYLPDMDETYHSTHGAVTEALYVFLDKGLKCYRQLHPDHNVIKILEVGFGTGLNAWLTAIAALEDEVSIQYTTLEKFPIDRATIDQLNYTQDRSVRDSGLFGAIHEADWNGQVDIHERFSVQKIYVDVFDFVSQQESFNIIFFDAFAPSKQPEMWSPEVLTKMYQCLTNGGVLTTYCAQGQFKRDLKAVGFDTESLPGPPGKKEMTRGIKPS